MTKIFISYRREDAGFAVDQIHAALKPYAQSNDDIFVDVDNIPPGVDFIQHLNKYVDQCDIMLVAIGPNWKTARLDDPDDFVRIEISSALARGIPVVPLLLGGAKIPEEGELPDNLKPLVRRQGVEVPRGGVQPAIDRMMRGLGFAEVAKTGRGLPGWLVPLAAVIILAAGGFGLWQTGMLDQLFEPSDAPVEVAVAEAADLSENLDLPLPEDLSLETIEELEPILGEDDGSFDIGTPPPVVREKYSIGVPSTSRSSYAIGSTFRDTLSDGSEGPEMVVIPAGSFMMGAPASEEGRDDHEGPQRTVTISKPFAVGKFEVTWAEWEACVLDGNCEDNSNKENNWGENGDAGWGRGNRPVINVSWEDAGSYVSWLSEKTGKKYSLLSEAQWEYAARAGTSTAYSWGSAIGNNKANCDGCGSQWDGRKTAPVGSFKPNEFGLFDMHGNVFEWVRDCWRYKYDEGPRDGNDWISICGTKRRVYRGGSWYTDPVTLRSAARFRGIDVFRFNNVGFRIARDLSKSSAGSLKGIEN